MKSKNLTNDIELGFYKYKSIIISEADCVREYPINEYILNLIEEKNIVFEIEMDGEKPKLIQGLGIILI